MPRATHAGHSVPLHKDDNQNSVGMVAAFVSSEQARQEEKKTNARCRCAMGFVGLVALGLICLIFKDEIQLGFVRTLPAVATLGLLAAVCWWLVPARDQEELTPLMQLDGESCIVIPRAGGYDQLQAKPLCAATCHATQGAAPGMDGVPTE